MAGSGHSDKKLRETTPKKSSSVGRLLLPAIAVLVILALALGLGLGIGLKKHKNATSNSSAGSSGSSYASLDVPSWRRSTEEYALDMTTWDINAPPTVRSYNFTVSEITIAPDGMLLLLPISAPWLLEN